tara:strand:+ start:1473 stop:2663 length:1191 start_codon:yes stop_codon:yes gene_type:complete
MSLFKEKKKKVYKKKNTLEQTTIDSKHNNQLEYYTTLEKNIPSIKNELIKLEKEIDNLSKHKMCDLTPAQIENKLNLIEKKESIEKHLKKTEEQTSLNDYIMNTGHILYDYYDESNIYKNALSPKSKKKSVLDFFGKVKKKSPNVNTNVKSLNKNQIMDRYLSLTEPNYVKNMKDISNENLDECIQCKTQRMFDSIHGCLICPKCGECENILVDSDTPSYKEPPKEITYFAYKKINHANEWLSQFQAKESTDISEEVFEKIQNELKKESYLNFKNITTCKVRDILKKLDLTKYYEHCHYITNRITGKPAPVIDGELEEKVRNMFKEIQSSWMKYCPNDRSNFFSYPYIFYKFFQLLDKDEYLPYCRLLKSREKLQEHDEVWKKICLDLKWQYIPTV